MRRLPSFLPRASPTSLSFPSATATVHVRQHKEQVGVGSGDEDRPEEGRHCRRRAGDDDAATCKQQQPSEPFMNTRAMALFTRGDFCNEDLRPNQNIPLVMCAAFPWSNWVILSSASPSSSSDLKRLSTDLHGFAAGNNAGPDSHLRLCHLLSRAHSLHYSHHRIQARSPFRHEISIGLRTLWCLLGNKVRPSSVTN